MDTPFPRSYWVYGDMFLAGAYPGSSEMDTCRNNLQNMLNAGIRCFISLMQENAVSYNNNLSENYVPLLLELAEEQNIKVSCHRIPIRDSCVPTPELMRQVLDIINSSIFTDKEPVYIHCWGGLGRTGTVVGCWLVEQGLATKENVIEMISELRKDDPCGDWPSPQTPVQIDFVLNWSTEKH